MLKLIKCHTCLLFTFFLFVFSFESHAQSYGDENGYTCMGYGMRAKVLNNQLHPQSDILLEGYGETQDILENLNQVYPVYLISGKDSIPLEVSDIFKGQIYITQVVLKHKGSLEINRTYELCILNVDTSYLWDWNRDNSRSVPNWKVEPERDSIFHKWIKQPSIKSKGRFQPQCGSGNVFYTCQNVECIVFHYEIQDSTEIRVKVYLHNLTSDSHFTYVVFSKNGEIAIGHNECYGAFEFGVEDEFEIEFEILNYQGKAVSTKSEKINFNAREVNEAFDRYDVY